MSIAQWLDMDSSHEVGECSVTVVCPLAGVHSDRPCHEIIATVVATVVASISYYAIRYYFGILDNTISYNDLEHQLV